MKGIFDFPVAYYRSGRSTPREELSHVLKKMAGLTVEIAGKGRIYTFMAGDE